MALTKVWHWTVSGAVVAVLLAVFIRLGYVIADGMTEPFTVELTEVLTPKVRTGEPVVMAFHVNRRRICTTTIAEFWIEEREPVVVYRNRIPGGYTPLGERRTVVKLLPPFALPPGDYVYRSVMESDCGVTSFTFPVPDGRFTVVP